MTRSLPRWVHRNLPRAAPPDSWRSLRSARVPPVHYLDKLPRPSLGATSLNPGVQFSMSKRVQFRTSVDSIQREFDRDGRVVAVCSTESGELNMAMVRRGWAVDCTNTAADDTVQTNSRL